MGRINKNDSLTGNVFMWNDVKALTAGGSWDFGLSNSSTSTKTAKIIDFGVNSSSATANVYAYWQTAALGGTTITPVNTNLSLSSASNEATFSAGMAAMTGGTILFHTFMPSENGLKENTLLSSNEDLCLELPTGKTFVIRVVPTVGGTIVGSLIWSER